MVINLLDLLICAEAFRVFGLTLLNNDLFSGRPSRWKYPELFVGEVSSGPSIGRRAEFSYLLSAFSGCGRRYVEKIVLEEKSRYFLLSEQRSKSIQFSYFIFLIEIFLLLLNLFSMISLLIRKSISDERYRGYY